MANRPTKEQRALKRARERRNNGDPLPLMMILKQERDRLGIVPPVDKSRRRVETVRSDLL